MEDLQRLQAHSKIPSNISIHYLTDLSHDFVVHPEMIDTVVQFCVQSIEQKLPNTGKAIGATELTSKL